MIDVKFAFASKNIAVDAISLRLSDHIDSVFTVLGTTDCLRKGQHRKDLATSTVENIKPNGENTLC